ncbi:Na(+)/H(+) exchange regulatory cofactor NHE-RF1 [Operophtera brumata]|uniref:Na(+)/H(+) exchange regulatory cofactor NHE-RF1 n=1 Tax=Operophtera brumata TaxID=104452 RepID=A0A0L7L0T2_OPEBR|nr:Na(+)/H(+) exchange regulatory cofactor NHE-RF1 [Operophtera brumata]
MYRELVLEADAGSHVSWITATVPPLLTGYSVSGSRVLAPAATTNTDVTLAPILRASAAIRCTLEPAVSSPRATHLSPRASAGGAVKEGRGGGARAACAPVRSPRAAVPRRVPSRARAHTSNMSANGNGSAATEPRLCHVRKTPDFDGYGFNLHAEKGKPGQHIGKVDEGSPAESAGLRRGDRILEVNGHSIAGETHKQVVARIKERADDTELLVAAPAPGDPLPDLDAPADTPAAEPVPAPAPALSEPDGTQPQLNLKMTAAEMRAHLAAKKKVDPKKVPMDLKSKFDIVKKL